MLSLFGEFSDFTIAFTIALTQPYCSDAIIE